MFPTIVPIWMITKKKLDKLNKQYNCNTNDTNINKSEWKESLLKAGYIWNEIDGWGYWSIPDEYNPIYLRSYIFPRLLGYL